MGIIKAIVSGMGTTVRKARITVILYAVNLVFAAVVAVPLFVLIQEALGHSLAGLGVRPVDLMWLGEAGLEHRATWPALVAGLAAGALAYLALHIYLNGGLVGRLVDREGPSTLAAFAGDGGRYFGKFARLFLVSCIFLVLTLGLFMSLVSALFEPLTKSAPTEWLPLILSNLHLLIALLLLSVVHMVVDYARIAVVADQERRILKALRHALTFLRTRFFRAWALYLLIALGTAAGTVVFYVVLGGLGAPTVGAVVAALVWMQAYIIFRVWTRALFVAAQAEFYRAHPY